MTSPNSLIFLILVRVSQRHTLDAKLLSEIDSIFLNYVEIKKKDIMTQTRISYGIVLCQKVGIKMLYSCQPVSLSNPLFSAELTIKKSIVYLLILYFPVHSR